MRYAYKYSRSGNCNRFSSYFDFICRHFKAGIGFLNHEEDKSTFCLPGQYLPIAIGGSYIQA
jgi:hypothetical protein